MGNCVFTAYNSTSAALDHHPWHHHHHHHQVTTTEQTMIKVVTTNGGIMELYAPITAEQITSEFPGHALFRSPDPAHSSNPLLHKDRLDPGQLYYLLPLSNDGVKKAVSSTPYRMSFDAPRITVRSDPDVVPRYNGTGVWKVRLVINPEQLSEILSQDAKTEELIESVRTVAKCGVTTSSSSSATSSNSDQCSSVSSGKFQFKASL